MQLKIFRFGEAPCEWVCHVNEEEAIKFYKDACGEECFQELLDSYGEEAVTEEPMDKMFNYYPDGITSDLDTIENHIKKYCQKPDFFASSEY